MVERDVPRNQSGYGGTDASSRLSTMFALLSDTNRRFALQYLRDRRGERVDVDDLVEGIATARASEAPVDRDALETRLYHSHLPKLTSAGVVDYHEGRDVVRYVGDPRLESALQIGERSRP